MHRKLQETQRVHLLYWILPSVFLLVCMAIYFLDIYGMSYIISPNLNREFGLIEHSQLLLIIMIAVLALRQVKKSTSNFERYFFLFAGTFSVFIFLEEIDYGIHYYELAASNTIAENATGNFEDKPRNIHNQGELRKYIMWVVYIGLIIVLGTSSFIKRKLFPDNTYVNWLAPEKWYFIYSLMAMVLLNELVRYTDQHVKAPSITSLNGNTIEFQETFIYYIALLYIFELTRKPFKARLQQPAIARAK